MSPRQNINLTNRARTGEGVVYTSDIYADIMVREAFFRKVNSDYPDIDRQQFENFISGRLDSGTAGRILATISAYSILDPSIGRGVFLNSIFKHISKWKQLYSSKLKFDLESTVSGIDIDADAIGHCQNSLAFKPHLYHADFLKNSCGIIPDMIIANPPYIRQELINQPYKAELLGQARKDWPGVKTSARSDLYIYFILKAARVLAPGGIMTFIVPNSWMDSQFGVSLRNLFTKNIQLLSIQEAKDERHFSAVVNTIIFTARNSLPEPQAQIELKSGSDTRLIKQEKLAATVFGWYGTYFRCPDWLRTILDNNSSLVPLGSQMKVQTGIITGNNRVYYSREKGGAGAVPAVKSPKELKGITCRESDAVHWLQTESVPYSILKAPLLWTDLRGSRHLVALNSDNLPFEHTLYGLTPLKRSDLVKWALLLNSTWVWLMVELFGRKSLGGGAVRMVKGDLVKLPIPDFRKIGEFEYDKNFLTRSIGSWGKELNQEDREKIDLQVFKFLGLDDYYESCLELTASLMEQRVKKGRH